MHFEFLIEDQSGKRALELLVPKILDDPHTYNIHAYKGIGKIPKNLGKGSDPSHRILLDQLPRLLRGYGRAFAGYPEGYRAAVVLVCDLDSKCLRQFRQELFQILESCDSKPETRFCIAIEEGEAWFLGDIPAIKKAYPKAQDAVLSAYINDSICGTWERLADAVYHGGSAALVKQGWQAIGTEKYSWAERIAPHMEVDANASPSFGYFVSNVRLLAET